MSNANADSWRKLPPEIKLMICEYWVEYTLDFCLEEERRFSAKDTSTSMKVYQLLDLGSVDTDLQVDIINICYRKFKKARADWNTYFQQHVLENGRVALWKPLPPLVRESINRIKVLREFFWESRADIDFGPITLTAETGAVIVHGADAKEEMEA